MWKLSPPGSDVSFYGNIVLAKPIIVENQRVGYKIIIRTTIKVQSGDQWIPIYVSYPDLSKNRFLYEWWYKNKRKNAPIYIKGKKRGQSLYNNTKLLDIEPSEVILWVFIRRQAKINPINEIPDEFKNLKVYATLKNKDKKAF